MADQHPDGYPNRETWNKDRAAKLHALSALATIEEHAATLKRRIEGGYEPYGSDAHRFTDSVTQLTVAFTTTETLRDVREWHALDVAEQEEKEAQS